MFLVLYAGLCKMVVPIYLLFQVLAMPINKQSFPSGAQPD